MAMVALAMYLQKMTPGNAGEKLEQLTGLMENPAGQVRFAASAIEQFVRHSEGAAEVRRARRGPGVMMDKGHPGVGGQGRAHRKKITAKKVRHAKTDHRGKTAPKV